MIVKFIEEIVNRLINQRIEELAEVNQLTERPARVDKTNINTNTKKRRLIDKGPGKFKLSWADAAYNRHTIQATHSSLTAAKSWALSILKDVNAMQYITFGRCSLNNPTKISNGQGFTVTVTVKSDGSLLYRFARGVNSNNRKKANRRVLD